MNLAERARLQGIHPQTVYRRSRDERLPVPAARVNARIVLIGPGRGPRPSGVGGIGVYARVSSHDRRADPDRQVARLAGLAARSSGTVARGEAEVGSGMNGARPKARRVLADPAAVTAVEDRDRLARVTTEQAEVALAAHGHRLAALNASEVASDMVRT